MARLSIACLFACVLLSNCAFAEESADATKAYVAGDQAWTAGDVDGAIAQWSEALRLKPTSTLTKDRLIEALRRKIDLLTKQLVEAETGKPKEIVIRAVGSDPSRPSGPRLLAPATYTADYVYMSVKDPKLTEAQRSANWGMLKGCMVQWHGKIKDVKSTGVGSYLVVVDSGAQRTVGLHMRMSDQQAVRLNVGRQVAVTGVLEDVPKDTATSGLTFYLTSGQVN